MVQVAAQGEAHTAGKIKELAGSSPGAPAKGEGSKGEAGVGGDPERAIAEPATAARDGRGGARAGAQEGGSEHPVNGAEPPHSGGRFGSNPDNVEEFLTDPNPVPEVADARAGMKNLDSPSTMFDARRVLQGLRAKLLANKAQEVTNVGAVLERAGVTATRDDVALVFDYVFDSQGIQFGYHNYSAWRRLSLNNAVIDDLRFLVHELEEVRAITNKETKDPTGTIAAMKQGTKAHRDWLRDFNIAYLKAHSEALLAEAEYLSKEVRGRTRGQVSLTREELAASDPSRDREFLEYLKIDGLPLEEHPRLASWQRADEVAHVSPDVAQTLAIAQPATIGEIISAVKRLPIGDTK
jgi:hypothetical protein